MSALGKNYSSCLDFTLNYERTRGIFVPCKYYIIVYFAFLDKTNVPTEKGNVPAEKRNVPLEKRNVPPEKRVPDKGRPLCGSKRKKEEEFTCSPLFIKPKNFRKGFTSSASSSSLKGMLNWPRRDKTFIRGFRRSESQTCLLSYRG